METSTKPAFQMHSDSRVLAEYMKEMQAGESVSYADLTSLINRDVQRSARDCLEGARRLLQREHNIVFATVRGEGIKRLLNDEIVDTADGAFSAMRRTAKRAARKLGCVVYDSLSREKQVKHNTSLSVFGVISEASTDRGLKRVEKLVAETGKTISLNDTALAALGIVKKAKAETADA